MRRALLMVIVGYLQQGANLLHVLPHVTLPVRTSQQERRMERRDQLGAPIVVHAAPKSGYRILRLEQRLSSKCPQRDDDFRTNAVDLLKQKGFAGFNFVRFGVAVLWRPTLDDVGNIHVVARKADGLDDLGKQLASATDKRNPLDILVRPWRLADKHQVRCRIADAKDNLPPAETVKFAPGAVADLGANELQRFRRRMRQRHRLGSWPVIDALVSDFGSHGCRDDTGCSNTTPPTRIEAHAGDAKLLEESEVLCEVCVIHDRQSAYHSRLPCHAQFRKMWQ